MASVGGVISEMMPTDVGFMFTGFILFLPILVLIIYVIRKVRIADPSKQRKYAAVTLIVTLIVSISAVVVIKIPPATKVELDITLNFRSNSTDDKSTYQYHWNAPGIQIDGDEIHIDWNEQYGETQSYETGALTNLLQDRGVEDFYIQWNELEPFTNETWSLLLNFYVGLVFEGHLVMRGGNQSIQVDDYGITETQFSTSLLEGLASLGIEGLEVYMDISFKIAASVLRGCFREISIELQIVDDLEMGISDIEFGIIS